MPRPNDPAYPGLEELKTVDGGLVLAIECQSLFPADGPEPLPGLQHRRLAELTSTLLAELCPSTILMPLFLADQDAHAVVEHLQELAYAGQVLVIAPHLPSPKMVERELRGAGPGMRLVLVSPREPKSTPDTAPEGG